MSCKALIDVSTTTSSAVVANGTLPLATVTRKRGNEISVSGNSIAIMDCGSNYYLVTINATFSAPVAGVVTLNLTQNGVNVVGTTASTTITTATTELRSLSFQKVIRTFNANSIDSLTLVNAGVAATFTNIDVSVIKL